MNSASSYFQNFRGGFYGILRWPQLDALWEKLRNSDADKQWYIYAIGETPPEQTSTADELDRFITEIDTLLHKEHTEDYCGIVYVDNKENPEFIKIYDPNNLGVVCGFSDNPPLPGWTLSIEKPVDLEAAMPPPASRRRWWQKLLGKTANL